MYVLYVRIFPRPPIELTTHTPHVRNRHKIPDLEAFQDIRFEGIMSSSCQNMPPAPGWYLNGCFQHCQASFSWRIWQDQYTTYSNSTMKFLGKVSCSSGWRSSEVFPAGYMTKWFSLCTYFVMVLLVPKEPMVSPQQSTVEGCADIQCTILDCVELSGHAKIMNEKRKRTTLLMTVIVW